MDRSSRSRWCGHRRTLRRASVRSSPEEEPPMHRMLAAAVLAVFATTQMGCYTTRVAGGIPPGSQVHEERQWFAILGLFPLSGAAGNECRNGVATAESQYNVVDALLIVALAAAGGIAGGLACGGSGDATATASCITGAANLVPQII